VKTRVGESLNLADTAVDFPLGPLQLPTWKLCSLFTFAFWPTGLPKISSRSESNSKCVSNTGTSWNEFSSRTGQNAERENPFFFMPVVRETQV